MMDLVTIVQIEEQHRMQESILDHSVANGLYWLAFILTGSEDLSVHVTSEVLSLANGSRAIGREATAEITRLRRAVILQTVAAQKAELHLARDRYRRPIEYGLAAGIRAGLNEMPDCIELRHALLAIDFFPRHALLLTVFEGFSVPDAARCLDSSEESIRDARSDGLLSLARRIAARNRSSAASMWA